MLNFETMWRHKIKQNTKQETDDATAAIVGNIATSDPIEYSRELIQSLRDNVLEEKIKNIFCKSACHMPSEKLLDAKAVYQKTGDIEQARLALEAMFKKDIKQYKNLSDEQVDDILSRGWGAAGKNVAGTIVATKIPSQFHEYFAETDPVKKNYYYCHCPRIKKELLQGGDLDSIYCNCGGGFYENIWSTITGKKVTIDVMKNLFDGDEVCQFRIRFED